MRKQAGFTLIEIAIVLVVIGLLLGTILRGQELVTNSRIRSAINEQKNIASAYYLYIDRYRQIPGDDPGAAARYSLTNPSTAPDGDRVLLGAWNNDDGTQETSALWQHLRADGLIPGARDTAEAFLPPRNPFDGDFGIQRNALGINGVAICMSNVPFQAATIIDTRLDDETGALTGSATGSVRAVLDTATANMAAGVTAYAADNRYIVCIEL
ncbi:MAG: type II secretion system protein [Gammaproteobacteria bacterium]|nr:type II secretion system protein [Gammaproteobacteria bacterium]